MDVFDPYIIKCRNKIDEMVADGKKIRVVMAPPSLDEIRGGLPIAVGPAASQGVILRSDTFVELGNPEAGSCSIFLYTSKPSLLSNGRITLLGPDIPDSGISNLTFREMVTSGGLHSSDHDLELLEKASHRASAAKSFPFAQIIMVAGKNLSENDYEILKTNQIIGDRIEGYMVRSFTRNIWSRVSREAAAKGFTFETLGKALIVLLKSSNPWIEAIEIAFVTTNKHDIDILEEYARQIQKISKEIVKENWKIKGYDIECASDCASCADKPVCDTIRDVLKEKRKEDRKLKFTNKNDDVRKRIC